MFGFLNVHKPPGPTSHDIVAGVRRLVGGKTKVGHAGSLDPFAEGVLVICVGPATRLAEYVQAAPKRYHADVTLGATSTTDDIEGRITPNSPAAAPPDEQHVRQALARFVGSIGQRPPAHSAVHVDGRRAYKLARAGCRVKLQPREVTIHALDLLNWAWPVLTMDVRCGTGTYIRALARDIGEALGVGGYCSGLTRTEVGVFRAEQAVLPDQLDPARDLRDPLAALEELPKITVAGEGARRLALGQGIGLAEDARPGETAVLDPAGRLLSIATVLEDRRTLKPDKVFAH